MFQPATHNRELARGPGRKTCRPGPLRGGGASSKRSRASKLGQRLRRPGTGSTAVYSRRCATPLVSVLLWA